MKITAFLICFIFCSNHLIGQTIPKDTLYDFDTENDFLVGDSLIYSVTETSASFYKGNSQLGIYIKNNLVYPATFKQQQLKESVLVKFIVERDGKLSNLKILTKNNKKEFIDEAIRIINVLPKWIPATHDGKKVRAFLTIPFDFCPENCAGWL